MRNLLTVRNARAEDKDAVLAFCQNTFSWGDYITDVYDDWLADAAGRLIVGVFADQPVGVVHVGFSGQVGWMEGMRVHPDFRQQGVASAMDAQARTFARAQGCHVARLATSVKNSAAQKAIATFGYQTIARFNEWGADATAVDFSRARVAVLNDLPTILAQWQSSDKVRTSHALIPTRHWRWLAFDRARLEAHIRAGEVRGAPNGFAVVPTFEGADSGLGLFALVGDDVTLRDLALAVRGEAHERGYARVSAILIDQPALNAAMEHADYQRDGGMLIGEQLL